PRVGTDPSTGRAYPDRPGSTLLENHWLRAWTHELYLWYREVEDLDPALYDTPTYFELLKTEATTQSGRPKDGFHFSAPTDEYQSQSESGISIGYGILWTTLAPSAPRDIRVAWVEAGSPAANSTVALSRGMRVLEIDGIDAVNDTGDAVVDALNAALYPAATGVAHNFVFEVPGTGARREVTLTATEVTYDPVPLNRIISTASGPVGYLLFNDHNAQAEAALIDAIRAFDGANVRDLIIDLRYNCGGFLDIASELAYMVAGSTRTRDRGFESQRFNDQHTVRNPVTGARLAPLPFHATSQGFSVTRGRALPSLSLGRVYVLTGADTCSASESIINALRGINVQVIQIGETTCGKPYGFYPEDNCGTTYFSIQFQGVNDIGFGDYADGFAPANTPGIAGVPVPGCAVADDLDHALGSDAEARLAAAIGYRSNGTCPAPTTSAPVALGAAADSVPAALASARGAAAAKHGAEIGPPPWRQVRHAGQPRAPR
ncbi:MAG: S41 family peptidase, partial [Gammaproteobacteria bacterium]